MLKSEFNFKVQQKEEKKMMPNHFFKINKIAYQNNIHSILKRLPANN